MEMDSRKPVAENGQIGLLRRAILTASSTRTGRANRARSVCQRLFDYLRCTTEFSSHVQCQSKVVGSSHKIRIELSEESQNIIGAQGA
jgi:hypothetical protein